MAHSYRLHNLVYTRDRLHDSHAIGICLGSCHHRSRGSCTALTGSDLCSAHQPAHKYTERLGLLAKRAYLVDTYPGYPFISAMHINKIIISQKQLTYQ